MFEVIRYIFDTNQDINLYYNQEYLIRELVTERFPLFEIAQAFNWFTPIIDSGCHKNYFYSGGAIRSFDSMEGKYLPKAIIDSILQQEKTKLINAFQRDILIDRLSILAQEKINETDICEILDNLVWHLNNYKFGLIDKEVLTYPTAWTNNFTLH